MLDLIRRFMAPEARYSDGGAIHCPLRKDDVEVDNCYGCTHVRAVKHAGGIVEVRCEPPSTAPHQAT